jgi:hypothetical protein
VYCGLSYQVDATELIAEASEVDSAAGIERVVPSMYAEIIWPLKSVRHCFQRNRPITYTSRDVTDVSCAALARQHRAMVEMDPNLILALRVDIC